MELQATLDGVPLASTVLDKPGQQGWTCPLRPVTKAKRINVVFTARSLSESNTADGRSLGIVVSEIKLRGAEARVPSA